MLLVYNKDDCYSFVDNLDTTRKLYLKESLDMLKGEISISEFQWIMLWTELVRWVWATGNYILQVMFENLNTIENAIISCDLFQKKKICTS